MSAEVESKQAASHYLHRLIYQQQTKELGLLTLTNAPSLPSLAVAHVAEGNK